MSAVAYANHAATQVRFSGVGGQGIVLAGRLLGKAAALFEDKEAVCTQSYGPEARGGASRSDVVISPQPVNYPYVTRANVLVAFFQEAYVRFRADLHPEGLLIIEQDLVQLAADDTALEVPATRIAEELGSRLVANVVMLGAVIGRTGIVSRDAMEKAIRDTVKPHVVDIDLRALDAGIDFVREVAGQ